MKLEVVGPERRDDRDRRASRREAEMRARQLGDDYARVGREGAGGRPEVAGASGRTVHLDSGLAQEPDEERRRRRLAGGARDADRRYLGAFEDEVAEAPHAAPKRATVRPRATSGVRRSRNASSCSPGSRSRSACSRTSTPSERSSSAAGGASSGPATVTVRPSAASNCASATASSSNPSTSVTSDAGARAAGGGAAVPPQPTTHDCARIGAAKSKRLLLSAPRLREPEVDLARRRIGPARRHDLAARVEVDRLRPVGVRVAEQ